jgi:hypothetical protein
MKAASDAAAPKQASELGLTEQTQKLVQAKSGRSVGPSSVPAASNVQEQIANQQQALQASALAQQAQLGAEVMKANEQAQQAAITQQQQELTSQAEQVDKEFLSRQEDVLDSYLRGQKQLNLQKDKAALEQVGFSIRLNNSQYISNLEREAKRSGLTSDVRFKEEMARAVYADEMELFNDSLDFRSALFADKLEFNEMMNNMDLDFAIDLARQDAKQASSEALWTGVGALGSGAVSAGGQMTAPKASTGPEPAVKAPEEP